jgi:hypothetical protein
MFDTRVAPRVRVAKSALIEHGGDKTPCIVRDLSVSGAALELNFITVQLPPQFNLLIPEDGLKLPCQVVWRRGFRIGVQFE